MSEIRMAKLPTSAWGGWRCSRFVFSGCMSSLRGCSGSWLEALPTPRESYFTRRNECHTTIWSGIYLLSRERLAIFALFCGMLDRSRKQLPLGTRKMSNPVDKLIEEWLAENEGEELPGTGQPLNLDEYFSWPEDQRIGLSLLKNSGCVPLEVEQLREIKRLNDEIERSKDEQVRARLKRKLQEERVQLNLRIEQSRRRRNR